MISDSVIIESPDKKTLRRLKLSQRKTKKIRPISSVFEVDNEDESSILKFNI
jgi:hypothetical protein